jgi:hypothetical protein
MPTVFANVWGQAESQGTDNTTTHTNTMHGTEKSDKKGTDKGDFY